MVNFSRDELSMNRVPSVVGSTRRSVMAKTWSRDVLDEGVLCLEVHTNRRYADVMDLRRLCGVGTHDPNRFDMTMRIVAVGGPVGQTSTAW